MHIAYSTGVTTMANSYTWTTGSFLPLGHYVATCTARSGTTHDICPTTYSTFNVVNVSSGCNPNFQGDVTF